MTFASFPDLSPSRTTRMGTRQPVRMIRYGGGHRSYIRNGTGSADVSWTVHWAALSKTEGDTITSFLEGKKGVEVFLWTAPTSSVAQKFICMEWTVTPLPSGHLTIEAIFIKHAS